MGVTDILVLVLFLIILATNGFFVFFGRRLTKIRRPKEISRYLAITVLAVVANILLFSLSYCLIGLSDGTSNLPVKDYWQSLYFSVVTWTTLGYGDYRPIGIGKAFAALEAMMGYLYMALLMGLFLFIVQTEFNIKISRKVAILQNTLKP